MEKKRISRSKPWGIESFRDWLVEEEEEPAKEIKEEKLVDGKPAGQCQGMQEGRAF